MKRLLFRICVLVVVASTSLIVTPPAHALFHLMMITEVFAGTTEQPEAQFIEMQMYADNQRFLASHQVVVYDAAGAESGRFTFTAPVDNGANQAHVLLATPEAEELFGVAADLLIDAALASSGGKACFVDNQESPIDCASWGSYSGDAAGSGTPFNSPVGMVAGQSMARTTTGGENPDGLDAEDDTDDSAADFESASPSPTNNAGSASQTKEHERAVTLKLKKRTKLVASGDVESEFAACANAVRVKIQRKATSGWKSVGSAPTDQKARFKIKVTKRQGTYRAKVPASIPEDGHECLVAVSPKRKVS